MTKKVKEKWSKIINDQKESNMTIKDYCKDVGIASSGFYKMRKILESEINNNKTFIKADIVDEVTDIPKPIVSNAESVDVNKQLRSFKIGLDTKELIIPIDISKEAITNILMVVKSL